MKESKDLTECRKYFLEPANSKQRQYEALRAYYLEGLSSQEAAQAFGYTSNSFRVLCHQFRNDPEMLFFVTPKHGPQSQPKKSEARELVVKLRKRNHSVYEISEIVKERNMALSPTAVREILKEEGFARLPRRLDEERLPYPRPTVESVADVRTFDLQPRRFTTSVGGLFLFIPDLVRLDVDRIAEHAKLPGSQMIPRGHALRACLSLKLWSIERKSHIMALVTDEGFGLFDGLNITPKKSYLSEYSSRITGAKTMRILGAWHEQVAGQDLFTGKSFNLDFHSVPYYGEHPVIEKHYVSARSRSQPSIMTFLAQDAEGRAFCYSNADIRKGDEPEEVFRFIQFWKRTHGEFPHHLVFDSRLTTYRNLAKIDNMGIVFITLRRRTKTILKEIASLPRSAWRQYKLDLPTRKFRMPRMYEQMVSLEGHRFRQLAIENIGHDEPTLILTNEKRSAAQVFTRYAQRMIIENSLSDAVRFFHMDALSSAVGLKIDFDMALLVLASGLYRLLARRMRGYKDAQARQIFRDLINAPADVEITQGEVIVKFHRRAHLPIISASGLFDEQISVPWWNNFTLRLTS
jgi:transposase